ncbi:MAG: hypothetical protein HYY13_07045, partial [Nitrospirae bacterium]|nr:hypothetical protein [Nitrospirota bacterium]
MTVWLGAPEVARSNSSGCDPATLIREADLDPQPLLSLLTSYVHAATTFDPPTWEDYSDGVVPHVSHNRPYYLVEVVPRPGNSPVLPIVSGLFQCLYGAMDHAFLRPLDEAITGSPRGYDPLKRGNEPGHYFFDAHVYRFVIDPLDEMIGNYFNNACFARLPARFEQHFQPIQGSRSLQAAPWTRAEARDYRLPSGKPGNPGRVRGSRRGRRVVE